MRILFIFCLLHIVFYSQSFSQKKVLFGSDKLEAKVGSQTNDVQKFDTRFQTSTVESVVRNSFETPHLRILSEIVSNSNPVLKFSPINAQEVSEKITLLPGIVIGSNYVCITRGSWQWESGRLKYYFSSKIVGSLRAVIKKFKFNNLEVSLNVKL